MNVNPVLSLAAPLWLLCWIAGVKKPAGTADEIESHFSCESSRLIMVSRTHI